MLHNIDIFMILLSLKMAMMDGNYCSDKLYLYYEKEMCNLELNGD